MSKMLKNLCLPFFVMTYPLMFHYSNNVHQLLFSSFTRTLLLGFLFASGLYLILLIINRKDSLRAANESAVFLLFFFTYGIIYSWFIRLDIIQIDHFTFLPLYIFVGIYTSWLIGRLNPVKSIRFWNSASLILLVLILFNFVKIIPAEIEKSQKSKEIVASESNTTKSISSEVGNKPDIYYIVWDEFAGLDVMKSYWKNNSVDQFKEFLETKGFLVLEKSRSSSIQTLLELSTRLNYEQQYNTKPETYYLDLVADNKVMAFLKQKGYTTIAFEEMGLDFKSSPPVKADHFYDYQSGDETKQNVFLDEFGMMVADNTMAKAVDYLYRFPTNDPRIKTHKNMISFTVKKLSNFQEFQSPKFVYVHLMSPHAPFIFDAEGNVLSPFNFYNWDYYMGQYFYTIILTEQIVNNLVSSYPNDKQPVIIIQSDHGARNQAFGYMGAKQLENYPKENMTHILNAMYLPGFENPPMIAQDINPVNTFPIIFNHYFNAGIPLK